MDGRPRIRFEDYGGDGKFKCHIDDVTWNKIKVSSCHQLFLAYLSILVKLWDDQSRAEGGLLGRAPDD